MAKLQDAVTLFEQFKTAFDNNDLNKSKELLPKLKILMTEFSFLVPSEQVDDATARAQLILAREILELATLLSVKLKDIPSFKRHIAQVKTYYHDTGKYSLPPSERQYSILGLNLLHLLSVNPAEFHTELELIPIEKHKNIYIKHPIQLEQYLVAGAYNKLWSARADVPADTYTFFVDILMNTVRDEIAECSEKAYKSLPAADAQKILLFSTEREFNEYAKHRNWERVGNRIVFKTEKKVNLEVPATKLISQHLIYAKELERIV